MDLPLEKVLEKLDALASSDDDDATVQCTDYINSLTDWSARDDHMDHLCYHFLHSSLFQPGRNQNTVDRLVNLATMSHDTWSLCFVYAVLLRLGRENKELLNQLRRDRIISKLRKEIINPNSDVGPLQCTCVQLLYEVCRVHKLGFEDTESFDPPFLNYLMDVVESSRDQRDETFNYSVIRLVLALNEQFIIVTATSPTGHEEKEPNSPEEMPSTNRVLKALESRIDTSKTFGENLVFMLNRAQDQTTQILILKLLYLVFTNPGTMHYFYTNDLNVLLDVILRQLWDLSDDCAKLRHAYLRVLHPLLLHAQQHPSDKTPQIKQCLCSLIGTDQPTDDDNESDRKTTVRLARRVLECIGQK